MDHPIAKWTLKSYSSMICIHTPPGWILDLTKSDLYIVSPHPCQVMKFLNFTQNRK